MRTAGKNCRRRWQWLPPAHCSGHWTRIGQKSIFHMKIKNLLGVRANPYRLARHLLISPARGAVCLHASPTRTTRKQRATWPTPSHRHLAKHPLAGPGRRAPETVRHRVAIPSPDCSRCSAPLRSKHPPRIPWSLPAPGQRRGSPTDHLTCRDRPQRCRPHLDRRPPVTTPIAPPPTAARLTPVRRRTVSHTHRTPAASPRRRKLPPAAPRRTPHPPGRPRQGSTRPSTRMSPHHSSEQGPRRIRQHRRQRHKRQHEMPRHLPRPAPP